MIVTKESGSRLCVSPLDAELDQQLTGSGLLLSALLQNTVHGSGGPDGLAVTSEGPYDFYQQPNMSEARLCLPVLEQLSVAVKQRLGDWPEHPALVQVSDLLFQGCRESAGGQSECSSKECNRKQSLLWTC